MADASRKPNGRPFRPRARILQLMGDELIGNPRLAVFELVKNAYDADADVARVTMRDLEGDAASIEVFDDGLGMSRETIENIWLVPGHDHKAAARRAGKRTDKGRLPLGEKGLGRFAVHKLGDVVEVVTRVAGSREIVLTIDWEEIEASEFLDQVPIEITERTPEVFVGAKHGTRVRITQLRGKPWTRGEVRRLSRQIGSISSPFIERKHEFRTELILPDQRKWTVNMLDTSTLLKQAIWDFEFQLVDNQFTWNYSFNGVRGVKVARRSSSGDRHGVLLDPNDIPEDDRSETERAPRAPVSPSKYQSGIGPISGHLSVYDRDREVWEKVGSEDLRLFLDESGGIRVYRDGMRVYNYGEPGEDWLNLDLRRVNSPSKKISNNIVVGVIDLDLKSSIGLVEKTNREGFVEGLELSRLRALVRGAIAQFEAERSKDKRQLREALKKGGSSLGGGIDQPLAEIRRLSKRNGLDEQMEPLIQRAQRAYNDMRNIMLRTGVSGMSLVIVYHEVEHGVRLLQTLLKRGAEPTRVLEQARLLVGVFDSFGDLVRRGDAKVNDLRAVVQRAADLNSVRLSNHRVTLETAFETAEIPNAELPLGLVLGAITNLIDNSLYWMAVRWSDEPASTNRKRLLLAVDDDLDEMGPSIVVADNGAGFVDALAETVEPFFTRRPDGIGVGLYYVNLIMQSLGGQLQLISPRESPFSKKYDGAIIALTFKRA